LNPLNPSFEESLSIVDRPVDVIWFKLLIVISAISYSETLRRYSIIAFSALVNFICDILDNIDASASFFYALLTIYRIIFIK